MAYTEVTATTPLVPLNHGNEMFIPKRAIRLDPTADVVAVVWTQKRTPSNSLSTRVTVWLIDAVTGEAIRNLDPENDPIIVDFKQNVVGSIIAAGYTAAQIIKRVGATIIGEPVPANSPLQWPVDMLEEMNIRSAIATARASASDQTVTF